MGPIKRARAPILPIPLIATLPSWPVDTEDLHISPLFSPLTIVRRDMPRSTKIMIEFCVTVLTFSPLSATENQNREAILSRFGRTKSALVKGDVVLSTPFG